MNLGQAVFHGCFGGIVGGVELQAGLIGEYLQHDLLALHASRQAQHLALAENVVVVVSAPGCQLRMILLNILPDGLGKVEIQRRSPAGKLFSRGNVQLVALADKPGGNVRLVVQNIPADAVQIKVRVIGEVYRRVLVGNSLGREVRCSRFKSRTYRTSGERLALGSEWGTHQADFPIGEM